MFRIRERCETIQSQSSIPRRNYSQQYLPTKSKTNVENPSRDENVFLSTGILTLFSTSSNGNFIRYSIEQAYNIFDMNVTGAKLRHKSMTYTMIVGYSDAKASVMMFPEADQVNTSIWPGVSNMTYLCFLCDFWINDINCENFVANKFKLVTMAPLGPNPYCFITSFILILSLISVKRKWDELA